MGPGTGGDKPRPYVKPGGPVRSPDCLAPGSGRADGGSGPYEAKSHWRNCSTHSMHLNFS